MPTRCPKKCPMAVGFVLALASAFEVGASTVTIVPVADTFLTEFSPTNNTGAHTNLAAGTVSNGTRTRALLRFDIAAQVPPGARIDAASLQIEVTRVNAGGGIDSTFELRRVKRCSPGPMAGPPTRSRRERA